MSVGSTRGYQTNILSSVLAVIHHFTSLATRLHEDLNVTTLNSDSTCNSSIGGNLPDANGRYGETLDKITLVHSHTRPET